MVRCKSAAGAYKTTYGFAGLNHESFFVSLPRHHGWTVLCGAFKSIDVPLDIDAGSRPDFKKKKMGHRPSIKSFFL